MIEVEKKFDPSSAELLLQQATFIKEIEQDDVIYDTDTFYLATHNACLRQRNGLWELKLSKNSMLQPVSIHDEISGYNAICAALSVSDLSDYHQAWHLITKRKKYKYQDFALDLDHVVSTDNDFIYDLLEIELMVSDASECPAATARIVDLANKYGLSEKNGKNLEYFKRYCEPLILNESNITTSPIQ